MPFLVLEPCKGNRSILNEPCFVACPGWVVANAAFGAGSPLPAWAEHLERSLRGMRDVGRVLFDPEDSHLGYLARAYPPLFALACRDVLACQPLEEFLSRRARRSFRHSG